MLEWKSRLVILLVIAASFAVVLGNLGSATNHGW